MADLVEDAVLSHQALEVATVARGRDDRVNLDPAAAAQQRARRIETFHGGDHLNLPGLHGRNESSVVEGGNLARPLVIGAKAIGWGIDAPARQVTDRHAPGDLADRVDGSPSKRRGREGSHIVGHADDGAVDDVGRLADCQQSSGRRPLGEIQGDLRPRVPRSDDQDRLPGQRLGVSVLGRM